MAAQIRMAALTLSLVVRSLPLATRVAHETSRSNLPARPRRLRAGGGAGGLSSTFFLAIFWVEHVSLASVVSGRGKPATRPSERRDVKHRQHGATPWAVTVSKFG